MPRKVSRILLSHRDGDNLSMLLTPVFYLIGNLASNQTDSRIAAGRIAIYK